MSNVVVTIRVMPESIDVDINSLNEEVMKHLKKFTGREDEESYKKSIVPVAFGLQAIQIIFVYDEKKGGTDPLEDILRNMEGVGGVEILDVRRAMG